jgi:hypothetical protein
MTKLLALLMLLSTPSQALDAACTTTTNLSMARCPENSIDWYQSYTDQIDSLDSLAKTAPSSFTVLGDILTTSSVTASAFFGDGSALTGITGGAGTDFGPSTGTLRIDADALSVSTQTNADNIALKADIAGQVFTDSISGPDMTATVFSSAPIVYVSTLSIPNDGLAIFGNDGLQVAMFDGNGASRGLRVNGSNASWNTASLIGALEVIDSGDPWIYFRRNDTGITSGELLGGTMYRDNDTSTGGTADRQYDIVEADGGWSSNQTFATIRRFGIDTKAQSEPQDVITITSTGTYFTNSSLGSAESGTPLVACGTCVLQAVAPAGSGVSITGLLHLSRPIQTATGWEGTSAGTITAAGFVSRNSIDVVVISTIIPCDVGVASITFVVSFDTGAWDMNMELFQVSAATGIISLAFDDFDSVKAPGGTRYAHRYSNAGENGPYSWYDDNNFDLVDGTSARWHLRQNAVVSLDVKMTSKWSPAFTDHFTVTYQGGWEQNGDGTGEMDYIYGSGTFNNSGTTVPSKVTIFEPASTIGQGLFCGHISLKRRAF